MIRLKSNIGWMINKSVYDREYIMKLFSKSRNTVSNWCTGKSYPSAPELFYLADLLGCKVDDLYERIVEERKPTKEEFLQTPVEYLDFEPRYFQLLKRNWIDTYGDFLKQDLKRIRGAGPKALEVLEPKFNELKAIIKNEYGEL